MIDVLIYLILFAVIGTFAYAAIIAAPWVWTKRKDLDFLFQHIEIGAGKKVYDLGCGDGAVLFFLARKYPEAQYVGFEISVLPFVIAIARKLIGGQKYRHVEIKYHNFYNQSLREADLVFVFLMPKAYGRLQKKFAKELKDEAIVIAETWRIGDAEELKIIKKDGMVPYFLYRGKQFRQETIKLG